MSGRNLVSVSSAPAIVLPPARELRVAGAALVTGASVWPVLPVHPPFACPLRAITGIPCPLCGMTRACIAAVHGHLGASLAFNPAGVLVVLLAVVALVRPQALAGLRPPGWLVALAFGALWLWNIGFNPTFHQLLLH
jgi:Protein of unknown function (DUF2752)